MARKKLKDLVRPRHTAAVATREEPQPPSMDRFLQSYAELTDATVQLYRRLDQEDPLLARLREVLSHAQEALGPLLGDASPASIASGNGSSADGHLLGEANPTPPSVGTALALRGPNRLPGVQPPRLRSDYPNQASIARYVRHRRRTGPHYPDEATIARYLKHRRETGPHYPDEAAIPRYFRRRRELYQLNA